MGQIAINRLTNANVYINGASMLGRAEEVTLPDLKAKMSEHKALGMVASAEFFAGIDKMEAKFKWNALYKDVMQKVGNPYKSVQIQVRGSLETYEGAGRTREVAVVTHLKGTFKNFPLGTYKQQDNTELESQLNVLYVKQVIDGTDVIELDVLANIFRVNGEDVLATYRANIGG